MKIVLASSNAGKIRELASLLLPLHIDLIAQSDLGVVDVEETGLSFIENALLKARHAAKVTGLPAIADDSGLAVHALNGAPGIYSARYAGNQANSHDNITKLLSEMKNVPAGQRQAAFHCVLAFMHHDQDPTPIVCDGQWNGVIATKSQGQDGFGYDPIFFIPELNKTAAELSSHEKNQLSHRGKALQSLIHQLSEIL